MIHLPKFVTAAALGAVLAGLYTAMLLRAMRLARRRRMQRLCRWQWRREDHLQARAPVDVLIVVRLRDVQRAWEAVRRVGQ